MSTAGERGKRQSGVRDVPRLPPAVLPAADARTVPGGAWFGADRLEGVADGTASGIGDDVDALQRARRLTDSATALDPDGRGGPSDRAVRLHVLAAELKRLNGGEAECLVDYMAISRHFQLRADYGVALSYMHKAMHVAERSSSPASRLAAELLAAETYVKVCQGAKAREAAGRASILAADIGDAASRTRALSLADASRASMELCPQDPCPCGGDGRRPFAECCGTTDHGIQGELSVRVLGADGKAVPSPFWSPGTSGIDVLMAPPRTGGRECLTFYSWGVEKGRHSLLSYPNRSARAMNAAVKLLGMAWDNEEDTAAPASAILQAVCALEAFTGAWKFFMQRETGDRGWPRDAGPRDAASSGRRKGKRSDGKLSGTWLRMGRATFHEDWSLPREALRDFNALYSLRTTIAHSLGDPEKVTPGDGVPNEHVQYLLERKVRLRPPPANWADRVLSPWVAEWAVGVAAARIAEVREAYAKHRFTTAMRERAEGIELDEHAEDFANGD